MLVERISNKKREKNLSEKLKIMKSTYLKRVFWMLIVLISSIKGYSNEADSLRYYLQYAADNNHLLKSVFAQYEASLQKIPQAGSFADPQLEIGLFVKPMDNLDGAQVSDLKIMQMFPWFGTRKAARTEAQHMSKVLYEKFRATRDDLFFQINSQWFILCNLNQRLQYTQANIEILQNLKELTMTKLSSSSTGMSEVLRIELEIEEHKNSIKSLISEMEANKAQFNALLGRSVAEQILIPDKLEKLTYLYVNDEITLKSIMHRNPEIIMLTEESLAYKAKEEMVKKMSYPMLGLGINYSIIKKRIDDSMTPVASQMNGNDMIMPMLSISLPVWRKKYKSQQAENRFFQDSNRELLANTQNELEARYYSVKHKISDAERKIELYNKQSELANTTYNLILKDFVAGKSDLINLLQIQRQLLSYQISKSEAIAEYNIMISSLQKLVSKIELN